MQEYTIKRVSTSDKKADGTPLISRANKPFLKVGIQVAEYGETWINGLWFDGPCPWKEGDKVQLVIKDEEYNGKISKKFELPRKEDKQNKLNEQILNSLTSLHLKIDAIGQLLTPKRKDDHPEMDETNNVDQF